MKHCSMPVISTSYDTGWTRRRIISSTPGWKSSPTWSLRTFPLYPSWSFPQEIWRIRSAECGPRHLQRSRGGGWWEDLQGAVGHYETAHCKGSRRQEHGTTDYTTLGKPSAPAPKPAAPAPDKGDDKNSGGRADKPAAPNPKAKPKATPALPSFNPKSHNGKGGKPRSRSPSREKAKTFCHYHFNQGNCKHGDRCPYSHSKYHWDKKKKTGGKGKGKSRPPGWSTHAEWEEEWALLWLG